jgi:NADH:ubiquinone oxidoreductase subunit F (NADH-binding)
MSAPDAGVLLAGGPVTSLREYQATGGGRALATALRVPPDVVIDEVRRSGLRGRGGAGFPTGVKWAAISEHACPTTFLVCNAAEGEPGTFKDRWLLRHNPYQVLEGVAIAAYAVGAACAYVAVKGGYQQELAILRRAIEEMEQARLLGPVPVTIATGPDEYLFGEEKALLEVLEGNEPLPRILPSYQVGLFARPGSPNPTLVNNVETLANVPHIIRAGAEHFRLLGTDGSPGTMLFTLCGDVRRPGVYELPLGVPLRTLLYEAGGGPSGDADLKAVFPGVSHGVLDSRRFATPLDFDAMRSAGSGLGSGGFLVLDSSACIVAATLACSRFLYVESCAQCPACKSGSHDISEILERIERGDGEHEDLETLAGRCRSVTGGHRCALPVGHSYLVRSSVERFADEFAAHLGRACPRPRELTVPKIVDFDRAAGRFRYDTWYAHKRADWSYAPGRHFDSNRLDDNRAASLDDNRAGSEVASA